MTARNEHEGRYSVVRHHDKGGAWYEVIDKRDGNKPVQAFRSRQAAHSHAGDLNSGWTPERQAK